MSVETLVFTPTIRTGGLDVLEASIARQTVKNFTWLVVDNLYEQRWDVWDRIGQRLPGVNLHVVQGRVEAGMQRNLCSAYNFAANYAKLIQADLFVSLQDYIWVPEDGISKFQEIHERRPDDLITGLTSISADPSPREVIYPFDENSYYSIFAYPYLNKPKTIDWLDCRIVDVYDVPEDWERFEVMPEHWEANWAAVPVSVFKEGVLWDESYDRGIAYENIDFAKRATQTTVQRAIILDKTNHAISLPHKDYFGGEREEIILHSNFGRHQAKWNKS